MNTEQEQIALEQKHHRLGIEDFRNRVKKLQDKGIESATRYGVDLLHEAVADMIPAARAWVDNGKSRPGRRNEAIPLLDAVDLEVACLIACRNIIDGITSDRSMVAVAKQIGHEIEDENRLNNFRSTEPALFSKVDGNLAAHPLGKSNRVRQSVWRNAAKKFSIAHTDWTTAQRIVVGHRLVELFAESTGLAKIEPMKVGRLKVQNIIMLTPLLLEWIEQATERGALLKPRLRPMICPPKDWSGLTGGGYLTPAVRTPLITAKMRGYAGDLSHEQMPEVYAAVNMLQRTAYRINRPVLNAALSLLSTSVSFEGWPRPTYEKPTAKPDYETDPKAWKRWKRETGEMMRRNLSLNGTRLQIHTLIDIAKEYREYAHIYFPQRLDFRGRMYPAPSLLNPQGSDFAKGLLTFADAKPLGKDGPEWLAIHLANSYGVDKVTFDERIAWVTANEGRIVATAREPLSDLWWTEADKPWQFFAACVEWAAMRNHPSGPEDYPSSLPVVVDGSCNGIQLFSLAMRDEVAGAQVNCVPLAKPADIYQAVADRLTEKLCGGPPAPNPLWPAQWLAYGISRKMCKRPVMVLPYSGTRDAFRTYINDHVNSAATAGKPNPFGKELGRSSSWLAGLLWETAKEVVVGPLQAMDWLRTCVSTVSKESAGKQTPLAWTTPTGFAVRQFYPKTQTKVINSVSGTSRVSMTYKLDTPSLNTRRQRNGIAPNFIHSLDAALLCKTINACRSQGVNAFLSVHDCYGTHAADMTLLSDTLRDQAVRMFEEVDVLASWKDQVQVLSPKPLPAPPAKGQLVLDDLRRADFFFA